jgi:hypothetical protein
VTISSGNLSSSDNKNYLENEMYPHYQSSYVHYLFLFLVSALLLVCIGCDSLLPTEFKAKNFTAADIDIKAGNLLTSDTLNDAQGLTVSYQYVPLDGSGLPISLSMSTPPATVSFRYLPVTWSTIRSQTLGNFATLADTTDNQIIQSSFNSLVTTLPELHQDSLIVVNYSGNKVSYAVLKSAQGKDVYLYTSLLYYYRAANNGTSNLSDYVSIDLVKSDTSIISPSTILSPESSYSSNEKILSAANAIKIVPVMSARYAIHLDQGSAYLVRFTLTNSSQISNPTQASPNGSIANQFKVVILSY